VRLLWLVAPLLAALWWFRGASHPPGVLVPEEPQQSAASISDWDREGFRIHPLAHYSIRARLIGKESYWIDSGAKLAPVDLAVAWGPLSDSAVLSELSWAQGNRFLEWRVPEDKMPLPFQDVNSHTANIHIVPATPAILSSIRWTRTGSIVQLSGYLIEATHPQGAKPWRSSLTRTDTGSGACELMWVEQFSSQ
jgi:hypothetical protein